MKKIKVITLITFAVLFFSASGWAEQAVSHHQAAHHAKAQQPQEQADQVNINSADAAVLSTLKGISRRKAETIIAYRDENGPFKSVDDLMKVRGIGEKILADNKARLTL